MNLTILGASPATQNPGGACSSYLVRHDATAIVLDMGSGAFSNLQRFVDPDAVAAIVVSHMHADHTLDLIPYRYWLEFRRPERRPRLLLPPGGHATLLRISGIQDPSSEFFSVRFDLSEYDPAQLISLGELSVAFTAMHHAPHTYGLRINAASAGALAYSADTGLTPAVLDLAREADLFLCESAKAEGDEFPLHLTARQAGEYARDAGVRRLLLTHRWHMIGLEAGVREAAAVYNGPISMAREHDTYAIS